MHKNEQECTRMCKNVQLWTLAGKNIIWITSSVKCKDLMSVLPWTQTKFPAEHLVTRFEQACPKIFQNLKLDRRSLEINNLAIPSSGAFGLVFLLLIVRFFKWHSHVINTVSLLERARKLERKFNRYWERNGYEYRFLTCWGARQYLLDISRMHKNVQECARMNKNEQEWTRMNKIGYLTIF